MMAGIGPAIIKRLPRDIAAVIAPAGRAD